MVFLKKEIVQFEKIGLIEMLISSHIDTPVYIDFLNISVYTEKSIYETIDLH